jgi:hypothetical protein
MTRKFPHQIETEPTMLEKYLSAARVSRYSAMGNVLTLVIAQIMNFKNRASDKAAFIMAMVMLFLSAVSMGSGVFAMRGLKNRKAEIIALVLIAVAATVLFLIKYFG